MSHLERIRAFELEAIVDQLGGRRRVLEIGAGRGHQARALSQRGFEVEAVDLAASEYAHLRVWPVRDYDGRHLPFADASFDAVFSSNVLEHVADIEGFQAEIQRVLRRDGRAIHVLPTPAWRFWTNVSHYAFLAKSAGLVLQAPELDEDSVAGRDRRRREERGREPFARTLQRALRVALPLPHGERGNCITEMYYFSRLYWLPLFGRTGWEVEHSAAMHLFYTGHAILGAKMSLPARRTASSLLGSAARIYVLRKRGIVLTPLKIAIEPAISRA